MSAAMFVLAVVAGIAIGVVLGAVGAEVQNRRSEDPQ